MDWILKSKMFHTLERVPYGFELYYLIQKNITKSLPRDDDNFMRHIETVHRHYKKILEYFGSVEDATYFEFGGGWDLCSNLLMYAYGFGHQNVYDLNPYARPELINHTIDRIGSVNIPEAGRLPEKKVSTHVKGDLEGFYGIDYHAPADARNTGLQDGSVDVVSTTSVLEHIPVEDIRSIMREVGRICHAGSVIRFQIDYQDHYSYSDPNINHYNFLRFDEDQWERYNPAIYYQNRLRHHDYIRLFEESGFEILEETAHVPDDAVELLESLEISPQFSRYSLDELAPIWGEFVMRPSPRAFTRRGR